MLETLTERGNIISRQTPVKQLLSCTNAMMTQKILIEMLRQALG
jgi:hypothetical protein